MDYRELLEKYNFLLRENRRLMRVNDQLKVQLAKTGSSPPEKGDTDIARDGSKIDDETSIRMSPSGIDSTSDPVSKIRLFMSLFKGREDVYAEKWESKKRERSGFAPVCLNRWQPGLCGKPKATCSKCANQMYDALDKRVVEDHLRGSIVAGIYPLLPDETCNFLAMDLDEADWQGDVAALRAVCGEFDIPVAVERSQSGNGAHLWFFFEDRLAAALARKFGSALLTFCMNRRHDIPFKSYDRLFPSQDTMPKGGFGNLIALPFQKSARSESNSEFIDEGFGSYRDQGAFLSSIQKLSETRVEGLVAELCHGQELGVLKMDEEDPERPWEKRPAVSLQKSDFPERIDVVRANMLFVPKCDISQKALNRLKRLASFKNPMFYRQQAMRLSTYGHAPIISCADETAEYLCLPRGCDQDLLAELKEYNVDAHLTDKTYSGRKIDVAFRGQLRDEQPIALHELLQHDTGILSATTAFGKTIVAIKLIAERKVNTLILVDRINLLRQWQERLSEFLIINEALPKTDGGAGSKRGRKKKRSVIGQLSGSRKALSGIVDIALRQSLSRKGEVEDCVKDYGMIIADECHHASAFSYERILKVATARYVYGLTATPTRKDGHHPILLMQCGPIRYRDSARKQAEKRPFNHYIIPRFTSLRTPLNRDEKDVTIQELYSEVVDNETRNEQIVQDVIESHKRGRNCIVLTLRTGHVESLATRLRDHLPDVVVLTGGMGSKTTREAFEHIAKTPADKNLVLVATGSFIGEGFDEPRLDTLFLAMPISWRGTLQQYAGRLHRLSSGKKDVQIYDYVDVHIRMLERMYQKRLTGYASMGYSAKAEDIRTASPDIIFDRDSFLPVFSNDIAGAEKEVLIVSPFVRMRRSTQMIQHLGIALEKGARVIVMTRPTETFKPKDRAALVGVLALLEDNGISVVLRPNIHQKFAVMDQRILWYGSINLLSYGNAQESIMRIESANIANELIGSIETL